MVKKIFIFLIPLLAAPSAFSQDHGVDPANLKEDPVLTEEKVGDQWVAEPATTPSQEVDYVLESDLARKMELVKTEEDLRKAKQQQKKENAEKYDSFGGGITIIAMCIVIGSLIVLSCLFFIFGNISSWFLSHKKKQTAKVLKKEANQTDSTPDTGDVIAAISAALAQHFATDHDAQDTILTIKRLRKAYSPWNSKIYNMRHNPEVVHHHPKPLK